MRFEGMQLIDGELDFCDEVVFVLHRQEPGETLLEPFHRIAEFPEEGTELTRILHGVLQPYLNRGELTLNKSGQVLVSRPPEHLL